MSILLLIPILLITIPTIIGGIHLMKDGLKAAKEEKRQKAEQEQLEKDKQWFYNKMWNANWTRDDKPIDIRDIPQLSFEQWLTFYSSAPERWSINLKQNHYGGRVFCAIPAYEKGKIHIATFWETPEDLWKFMEWQENEYTHGNAAIFENERAKRLSKLAKCLKEDLAEKNKQVQKELDALEKEVAASMPPKKIEEDAIQKYMREQHEAKTWEAKQMRSLTDYTAELCKNYPDYDYAGSERMLTMDGVLFLKTRFIHKYNKTELVVTSQFDKQKENWTNLSTTSTMG